MGKLHSTFYFVALLWLGVWLIVPAQDIPETAYDESEPAAYEHTLVFLVAVSRSVSAAKLVRPNRSLFPLSCLSGFCKHRHTTGSTYPISYSLAVLDYVLRC